MKSDRKRKGKKRIEAGRLFVCGVGINRPSDTSLRVIQILKECDVVYYVHLDGAKLKEFFETFCRDVRIFDGPEHAKMDVGRRIKAAGADACRELKKGRKVAYVTYGHPVLYSDGYNMAAYCRSRGYAGEFIPAVSSVDSITAALSGQVDLTMFRLGYQVCLASQVLEPGFRKPSGALILLAPDQLGAQDAFPELCRWLQREYSPTQLVYGIKCEDGLRAETRSVRVDRLQEWRGQLAHMMSLVLPLKRI